MTVFIKLTTAGIDTGPFNLYSNATGGYVLFLSAVDKATLTAGFTCSTVPDGTSMIQVESDSELCINFIEIPVTTTTTTTTSTTTTTTTAIPIPLVLNYSTSGGVFECCKSFGDIFVNGISVYNWGVTTVPESGVIPISIGDIISVNAECYVSGVGCVETVYSSLTVTTDGITVAGVVDGSLIYDLPLITASIDLVILRGCHEIIA